MASLAIEPEKQAEVSRCRLPQLPGSDSGFLSADPAHFPEPLPVPKAWSSSAGAESETQKWEGKLTTSDSQKMQMWNCDYDDTVAQQWRERQLHFFFIITPINCEKIHQLSSCEFDECIAWGSNSKFQESPFNIIPYWDYMNC